MEPRGFERTRGHFGERARRIRSTEGAEGFLRYRAEIRIAGIQRRAQPRQDQKGSEVSLIENIDPRVGSQVSAISQITKVWIVVDGPA